MIQGMKARNIQGVFGEPQVGWSSWSMDLRHKKWLRGETEGYSRGMIWNMECVLKVTREP